MTTLSITLRTRKYELTTILPQIWPLVDTVHHQGFYFFYLFINDKIQTMETQSDNTYNEIENTEIFLKSVSDEDNLTADEVAQFEIRRLESGQVL